MPNSGPEGTFAYARNVFEKWDIGNNGQGNGILFMLGTDGAVILTVPGIAGAVPDVLLARLYRQRLTAATTQDELTAGIEAVLDVMIVASGGESTLPTAYDYANPHTPLLADPAPPTRERRWIIILSVAGAVYAGLLAWQRLRARRRARA